MPDLTFTLTGSATYGSSGFSNMQWTVTSNTTGGRLYNGEGGIIGNLGQTFRITSPTVAHYELPQIIAYGTSTTDMVTIFKDCEWYMTAGPWLYFSGKYRNLSEFLSFGTGYKPGGSRTQTASSVVAWQAAAVSFTLKNNSAIQQIKYKVGAGAETTINAGAQVSISNLANNTVLGINPILTPRPIHFTSNGRIQKITYNAIDYNVFPTDINVDVSGTPTLDITGNPAPEITVNYTNTSEPVITDT